MPEIGVIGSLLELTQLGTLDEPRNDRGCALHLQDSLGSNSSLVGHLRTLSDLR